MSITAVKVLHHCIQMLSTIVTVSQSITNSFLPLSTSASGVLDMRRHDTQHYDTRHNDNHHKGYGDCCIYALYGDCRYAECHNAECRGASYLTPRMTILCYYADCRVLFITMLNVIMLSVVMLTVVMLSASGD
jgi:hypothetical protein